MRWSKQGVPVSGKIRGRAIMAGLARAFGATLALCALMCAWVVLSAGLIYDFSDLVAAGTLLGAVLGGFAGGRVAGTLGSLHGFIIGLIYGLFLSALVVFSSGGSYSVLGLIFRTLILGVAGTAGGILGVNLSNKVVMVPKRGAKKQPGL